MTNLVIFNIARQNIFRHVRKPVIFYRKICGTSFFSIKKNLRPKSSAWTHLSKSVFRQFFSNRRTLSHVSRKYVCRFRINRDRLTVSNLEISFEKPKTLSSGWITYTRLRGMSQSMYHQWVLYTRITIKPKSNLIILVEIVHDITIQ